MNRLFFILLLLSFSTLTHARMYQWVDPDTNTTQLSGKPPYWYRSGEAGPRVIVYENGKAIDDTGIELSEIESQRLRQQALFIVEQDRIAAIEKIRQAEMQRAAFGSNDEEAPAQIIADPVMAEIVPVEDGQPETDDSDIEQQMRQLLEQYESLKTQSARELVESASP